MISGLLRRINNLNIQYKLFITYLAVVTVPFCIFLAVNIYFSSKDSEKQTLYSLQQVLSQTGSFLEFKTESVSNVLDVLALNERLQEIVTKDAYPYSQNVGFWIGDDNEITKMIFNYSNNNPEIAKIRLYMSSGLAAAAETEEYIPLYRVADRKWYRKLTGDSKNIKWFPASAFSSPGGGGTADGDTDGSDIIAAVRKIPSSQNINSSVGVIRADIPEKSIRTTLEQSLFTRSTSAFLINSDRELICTSGNTPLSGDAEFFGKLAGLMDQLGENSWKNESFRNEKYIIAAQSIKNTDWKLVLAVPYRDVLESSLKIRRQMLLIFLCIAPLTLPLSYMVASSSTKRIRKLIAHMKKAEMGDFNIPILSSSEDEIGQLTKNYNHMLTRMAMLIEEQFKLGHEIKNAELKALQAQINPHFLYNTLDLINWMSMKYKASEISSLVDALSKFYKLSLSRGEDVISIEDELNHVKAYVMIQNMRFSNGITLEIDVNEDMMSYGILKVILQPLVENAILHGILEKEEETGTIRISGTLDSGVITLRICDDGTGMSLEMLQEVPSRILPNEKHGYGIRNIDERIKLNYGMEYGLTYESKPGEGTTVEIRIPAIRYDRGTP